MYEFLNIIIPVPLCTPIDKTIQFFLKKLNLLSCVPPLTYPII